MRRATSQLAHLLPSAVQPGHASLGTLTKAAACAGLEGCAQDGQPTASFQWAAGYEPGGNKQPDHTLQGLAAGKHSSGRLQPFTTTAAAAARPGSRPRPIARPIAPPRKATKTPDPTALVHQTGQEGTVQASEWTPVQHKESGGVYYWNQATGETTAVGEPRPGPLGRMRPAAPPLGLRPMPATGAGGSLLGLVAAGAGIGFVFALFSRLF